MPKLPCRAHPNPDIWFSTLRRKQTEALDICMSCPVLEQCAQYALASEEAYGIWGGLTEDERRALTATDSELLTHSTSGAAA